ncbi:MAG: hypothetical protein PHX79_00590 [Sphaerochaetaceae bacterium]|nr:hypothetical protein [Sphaerochaetaceae bacterium]
MARIAIQMKVKNKSTGKDKKYPETTCCAGIPDVSNALADYMLNVSITFHIYFTKGVSRTKIPTKAYT